MHRFVLLPLLACFCLASASVATADPTVLDAEKLLKNPLWSKRIEGLEMLAAMPYSERGEKRAVGALRDEDWAVQTKAAQVLAKIGREGGRKALITLAVKGEVREVRAAAVESLKSLDPSRCVARLAKLAKKERGGRLKAHAIRAAGLLASADDLKKLRPFTRDKNVYAAAAGVRAMARLARFEEVRETVFDTLFKVLKKGRGEKDEFHSYVAAIEGLAVFDQEDVHTVLVDELIGQPDEDGYMPERLARSLVKMKPEGVAKALAAGFERLKKPHQARNLIRLIARVKAQGAREALVVQLGHKHERVRSEAVRALGILGGDASADVLRKALDDKSFYVKVEAVTALAKTLPPDAFRALGPRIREEKSFGPKLQFVVELAESKDPELGVRALAEFLNDKSWRVTSAAAAALGTLGIDKDLHYLEPLIEHKDWKIRGAAYEGMGRLRAKGAVMHLINGLKDRDPVVAGVCGTNLQILANKRFPPDFGLWKEWWWNNRKGFSIIKRSRMTKEELEAEAEQKKRDSRYAKPTPYHEDPREWGREVMQKARILVLHGAWDKVQNVLDHLGIEHTLLRAQELKSVGLNPNQIVLVNCEGNVDKKTRDRLRWFVNVGGYLMSTDWALTKAVRVCFPGYMAQFAKSSTGNDVVVVEEAAQGHMLTRGVFEDVAALKWWLEIQAFPISVRYPERCEVLVDSAEMRQRYGSSPMAAVFQWGLGKIQHSVSHFYLQEEGMQHVRRPRARMIFARDHLGLSLEQIRKMAKAGQFSGQINEATMKQIAPDYSMFRLIVNMVGEKSEWVEGL